MKNKLFYSVSASLLFLMLLSNFNADAQGIRGSRKVVSEIRQVPFFDAVKVSGSVDLFITQGNDFNVEVIADDNLHEYLEMNVRSGVLEIKMKPRTSLRGYKQLQVHITAPGFNSIQTSGSSDVVGNGIIRQESMKIRASGSSDVKLAIMVNNLDIECSGSSDAVLEGRAEYINARLSGSSDLKGRNLTCQEMDLELSGSSDAILGIEKVVRGSLRGSSDLKIIGNPYVKVSTSGSSAIKTGV